jgi:hypothetical protein
MFPSLTMTEKRCFSYKEASCIRFRFPNNRLRRNIQCHGSETRLCVNNPSCGLLHLIKTKALIKPLLHNTEEEEEDVCRHVY